MLIIKRILLLFSLVFLYFIGKEMLELYNLARSVHPYLGYGAIGLFALILIYFVAIPIWKIIKIPKFGGPVQDKDHIQTFIRQRMTAFEKNKYLKSIDYNIIELEYNEENFNRTIKKFKEESEAIRKKYITQLFYSTTLVQNGFIDAIIILSLSVNLIKELFTLYNGRVSNRDLFTIGKRVYLSMIIGGSQGVEYATEEVMSKLASDSMKGVPFLDKILGSLADGFVNAVLLTRVALITESYCTKIYIESDRELYPSQSYLLDATKNITSDISDRLYIVLKRLTIDKPAEYARLAVNPAAYVIKEAFAIVTDTVDYVDQKATGTSDKFKKSINEMKNPLSPIFDFFNDLFK